MTRRRIPGEDPMERMKRLHDESMKKYGWYAHYVPGDTTSPTEFNAHTHGFMDTWKHPDVQIVAPMPQGTAHGIFWAVVNQLKEGKRFEPGTEYAEILEGYTVRFAWAREGSETHFKPGSAIHIVGRPVLRIILPDKEGRTDRSTMEEPYRIQWEGTETWN